MSVAALQLTKSLKLLGKMYNCCIKCFKLYNFVHLIFSRRLLFNLSGSFMKICYHSRALLK